MIDYLFVLKSFLFRLYPYIRHRIDGCKNTTIFLLKQGKSTVITNFATSCHQSQGLQHLPKL
jgi:hypothetical protein